MLRNKTSNDAGSFGTPKLTLMLAAGLFVFSSNFFTQLGLVLKNRPVTATITERVQTCRVIVRQPNRSRTRTTMPCAEAEALRNSDAGRRTRIRRTTYVTLSYPLSNGIQHAARVRASKVRAHRLPVGSQIQVTYSKRNPNHVTLPKSWSGVFKSGALAAFCFIGLMLSLFGSQKVMTVLKGWTGTRPRTNTETAKPPSTYQDIMANLDKIVDGSGWRGEVGSGWKKPKPVKKPAALRRQHTKPAPVPHTGGVVSKRRTGFFGLLS